MTSQHNPTEPTLPASACAHAVAAGIAAVVLLGVIVVGRIEPHLAAPPGTYALLAMVSAAGYFGYLVRSGQASLASRIVRARTAGERESSSLIPSSWSVRRSVVVQNGRLALVEPTTAEAAELRRLVEVHLRDQLDAEMRSRVEDALVEGFAIGYRARDAEEHGRAEGRG